MKTINYISPMVISVKYEPTAICQTTNLGEKPDGKGSQNTESPARRLYV